MPTLSTRRAPVLLVAIGALLLAALATASQAGASTLYACVKKNGNARIFSNKPKCKKGEKKLSWNIEGLAGKNGASGANGANGATGKEGPQGKTGPAGPLLETLPSGRSEIGVYAFEGTGTVLEDGVSYSLPLASTPTVHLIEKGHAPPAQCPGTLSSPAALAGNLCVYEGASGGVNRFAAGIFNTEDETATPDRFGFGLFILQSPAGSNAWSSGTWAVTAP